MTKQNFGVNCVSGSQTNPLLFALGEASLSRGKMMARLCAAAGLGVLALGLAFTACDNGNNGKDSSLPPVTKTEEEKKQEEALDEFNEAKTEEDFSKLLTKEKFEALGLDANVWKSYSALSKEEKEEIAKALAAKDFKNNAELNKEIESSVLRAHIAANAKDFNSCLTFLLGDYTAAKQNEYLEKMYGYFAYTGFKELTNAQIDVFNEKTAAAKNTKDSAINVYTGLNSAKRTTEHTVNAVLEVYAIYRAALKAPAAYPAENPGSAKTLTDGNWENGELAAGEVKWYEFPVTGKKPHYVWWNDSKSGNAAKTCDIIVSAQFGSASGGKVFFKDINTAWSQEQKITPEQDGKVYLKVEAKEAGKSGTFAIVFNTKSKRPVPPDAFLIDGVSDSNILVHIFTGDVSTFKEVIINDASDECAGDGKVSGGIVVWTKKPPAGTYTFVLGSNSNGNNRKFLNVIITDDYSGSLKWDDGIALPIL